MRVRSQKCECESEGDTEFFLDSHLKGKRDLSVEKLQVEVSPSPLCMKNRELTSWNRGRFDLAGGEFLKNGGQGCPEQQEKTHMRKRGL